jgi:cobalamin-dependent methionine synthase I
MGWLTETIQQQVQLPLCIDSPDPQVIAAGLAACRFGQPMINSISGETERYRAILPLALQYRAKVVALCMDDSGMPETAGQRLLMAEKIIDRLLADGMPADDIYLDPLIKPVGTNDQAGIEALSGMRLIKEKYPAVHLICGLSNISFGLPQRKVLNQAFMIQAMAMGMDAYILDPLDKTMMGFYHASRVLLGQDEFCMQYIRAYRKGLYS